VNLALPGAMIVDVDSAPTSTGWRVDAEEYLRLVADLSELTSDAAEDPAVRGMVEAREQITACARETLQACRALPDEDLELLDRGQLLFDWVARLQQALSEEPRNFSGSLLATDVGRMDAIEETAREVVDRTTARDQEFLDGTPEPQGAERSAVR
jgi:hypothetical protein